MSGNSITVSPDKGSIAGNTVVTISNIGIKASDVAYVHFGNAAGSNVQVVSEYAVSAVNPNPPNAGAVAITLLDSNLNKYDGGTFTYMGPVVSGVHPASSSVAGNKTITIKGQYLGGTAAVNFGALGATDIAVISDEEITVKNAASPTAQKVDVRVIVQGVQSAINTLDKFQYTAAPNNGVPMEFKAKDPANTYIHFTGSPASFDASYYDKNGNKQTINQMQGYSLSDMISTKAVVKNAPTGTPVVLVKSMSGRIYVSFDGPIPGISTGTPDANNQTPPFSRYQYFEPTIADSQMNIDLSYIDFTSFSLSLLAKKAPSATNPSQVSATTEKLVKATAATSKTTNGAVLPKPADMYPNANFVRVISPQLGDPGLYHDFSDYLKTELKNKKVYISGTYVGTGDQPSGDPLTQAQSYDYVGTFDDKGNITLVPQTGSGNGSAAGVPTVQRGPGVGTGGGNILISYAALNDDTGIYGCNTPYTLGSKKPTLGITNDVYGQVVGDLLAGLNFGFVGNQQTSNGKKIGDMSSTEWWGGTMADGSVIQYAASPSGQGKLFGAIQSNPKYYNSYAGSLVNLTTGYGFPLQDRLGHNLMTMNTAVDEDGYLQVWIDQEPVTDF